MKPPAGDARLASTTLATEVNIDPDTLGSASISAWAAPTSSKKREQRTDSRVRVPAGDVRDQGGGECSTEWPCGGVESVHAVAMGPSASKKPSMAGAVVLRDDSIATDMLRFSRVLAAAGGGPDWAG
jgi:hypothetical protein